MNRIIGTVGMAFLVVAIAVGCGGGGGGGGGLGGGGSSSPDIVANTGPDMDGPISSSIRWITLDGTGSYDKSGDPITYSWTQTAGTAVTLLYSNTAYPKFQAPATAGNLTFQLTVNNGTDTASDSVTVSIKNFVARAGMKLVDAISSTGGTSVVATKNFTITGGTDFNTGGVLPGDTLYIVNIDNPDFGEYYINSVNSNTSITVQAGKNFEGSVPSSWAIYRTDPFFIGYNKATSFTTYVIGMNTGALSYSWSSTPSFMVTSGSTTNTLTFTTPQLENLTTLPEPPGVLGVNRDAWGREQTKITVTDDMGTPGVTTDDISDYEYVNFGVGHATSGLENVPLGDPVFMNGGTTPKVISSSTWTAEAGAVYTYSVAETSLVRSLHEEEDNMPAPLVQCFSLAFLDATPGTWYQSAAGTRVYIHSTDSGNPTSSGLKYRYYITDSWTWTGYDPEGVNITFYKPDKTTLGAATDQRTPYFMPTKKGTYTVTVTRALTGYSPATDVKTFTINAGQYVGVGSQVDPPADPTQGECGGCHGGSVAWLDDKVTNWAMTGHSTKFEHGLTSGATEYSYYQAKSNWRDLYCVLCHTTGTSFVNPVNLSKTLNYSDLVQPGTSSSGHIPNKGFDDVALTRNFNHLAMSSWTDAKNKYPDIAGKANIQCEACHGPGSQHAGDTAGIRKSMDPSVCARCHPQPQMWKLSRHGNKVESPAGGSTCTHCHEAFGAMEAFEAVEESTGPKTVFVDASGAPVLPDYQRRAITCGVCHNSHKVTKGAVADEKNSQLRIKGQVTFMNGVTIDAGEAAVCFMCHQSRKDTRSTSDYYTGRGSSHDSTAAEVLSKTNGMEYTGWTYYSSPHGIDTAFIVGGQTKNEKCLTCHMKVTPSSGTSGYRALGDHTWNMMQGGLEDGTAREVADETINTGGAVVASTKSFIVTAGPTFIDKVIPGDQLVLENGTDAGTYMITAVDSGWKVTTNAGSNFVGTVQPTLWHINSVTKYNTAACGQCHAVGPSFGVAARGDYDGDSSMETIEEEVEGLLAKLKTAMESTTAGVGLNDAALPKFGTGTSPFTITTSSGKVAYKGANGVTRKFPGPAPIGNSPAGTSPGADSTQQADWAALTTAQQTQYEKLYKAMYNYKFVDHDRSEGIHNTGYVVGLLQSSYYNLTGSSAGTAFTPIPGY